MKELLKTDKLGVITNSIFNHMLSVELETIILPPVNYEKYIENHGLNTVIIEPGIYEQDHPWFNKDTNNLIKYLDEKNIDLIIMTDAYKIIPNELLKYRNIIIDNNIGEIIVNGNSITMPLLVDHYLLNPKDSSLEKDVFYFKFDDIEIPSEFTEYHEKFKPNVIFSSVSGITGGLINSLIRTIKKSNIVYIFDDKRIDRLLLEYIQLIAVLQNTIIIMKSERIDKSKYSILSNDFEEDIVLKRAYIRNSLYRDKYILSKIRTGFLENTFINRKSMIDTINLKNQVLNVDQSITPNISVVACTRRKENIYTLIEQINKQVNVNLEVVLLTHGFILNSKEIDELTKLSLFNIKVLNKNSETSFGECLNECLKHISNDYFIKIDDDDYYFPNFIIDLWIALLYSSSEVVGKNAFFFYLEEDNMVGQRRMNKQYRNLKEVKGNTIFCSKETILNYKFSDIQRHVDSDLFERIREDKGEIYAIHAFDMCVYRASDKNGHTYQVNDSRFLRDAKMLYNGQPNETITTD